MTFFTGNDPGVPHASTQQQGLSDRFTVSSWGRGASPLTGVRICVLGLNVYVLRRKPCLCRYFAIVAALVSVAFADLPTLTILP